VFSSDLRVRVRATGYVTYPDASIVCGAIEYDAEDSERTTITNPVLLVEVLGDRGNKWRHYQRIPSLQEYILANHDPRIEIFRRTPSNTWQYFEVSEGNVGLACGATLDLAMLYADLPL
jgi:Uma2 family endonuclease